VIETQAEFQTWLAEMPDRLRQLPQHVPPELARELDFSPDSLVFLGEWLVETYDDSYALLPEHERHDCLSRYVGEVFRREVPANWRLRLKPRNYG